MVSVAHYLFLQLLKIQNPSLVNSTKTGRGVAGTGGAVWHNWSWIRFGGRKAEWRAGQHGIPIIPQPYPPPSFTISPALLLQKQPSGHSAVEFNAFVILICFVFLAIS